VWSFVDEPWQYRVLDKLPPGVDRTLLEGAWQMTPTERLDAVVELVELGRDLADALAARRPGR
jgi:hypothetical protein